MAEPTIFKIVGVICLRIWWHWWDVGMAFLHLRGCIALGPVFGGWGKADLKYLLPAKHTIMGLGEIAVHANHSQI